MNTILVRLFVAIFTVALGSAWAQEGTLPSCRTHSVYWTDCFGVREFDKDSGKDRYVGGFKNNTLHGQGSYTLPNGEKYVGEFKDGEPKVGTWTQPNGEKYVGEFKDGQRNGRGAWTHPNGEKYVGEFKDSKPSGQGTYSFADGRRYVHQWKDGMPEGIGIRYKADGSVESSGTYAGETLVAAHFVDPSKFGLITLTQGDTSRQRELEERAREQSLPRTAETQAEPTQAKRIDEAPQRLRELEERVREQERLRIAEVEAERKRREEAEARLLVAQQQQRPVGVVQQSLNVHALVIGNAAYLGTGRLENPVNDSRAISTKLRSLGFKVTEVEDANRAKLVTALGQFSRSAASADLSVLFYSGHGVQLLGTNYILPTDIDQSDLAQATIQGISLDSVIGQFLPGKTKLVFLDACRDNPLYQLAATRSVSKGLAPISVAEGTLIAYATKDGQVASDGGKGTKNSPFTVALLEHLSDPDDIAVVLRRVREKVKIATGGKQVPWDYGSLTGGALVLSAIKPNESKK